MAGRYFDTCYGIAKGIPGFNTFQVDNHYARHRLERCLFEHDVSGSFGAFQEAKQLLHRQFTQQHRYYPYRVARRYSEMYEEFFPQWRPSQQAAFINECKYIVDRIDQIKSPGIRKHYYVADAKRRLGAILESRS